MPRSFASFARSMASIERGTVRIGMHVNIDHAVELRVQRAASSAEARRQLSGIAS